MAHWGGVMTMGAACLEATIAGVVRLEVTIAGAVRMEVTVARMVRLEVMVAEAVRPEVMIAVVVDLEVTMAEAVRLEVTMAGGRTSGSHNGRGVTSTGHVHVIEDSLSDINTNILNVENILYNTIEEEHISVPEGEENTLLDVPILQYIRTWRGHAAKKTHGLTDAGFNETITTLEGLQELYLKVEAYKESTGKSITIKTSVLSTLVVEHHFAVCRGKQSQFSAMQYCQMQGRHVHDLFVYLLSPEDRGFSLPQDYLSYNGISRVYGWTTAKFKPLPENCWDSKNLKRE